MLMTGFSATLLACLLAQAEPAPPEPGRADPGPADPGPAEQGPAEQGPAEQAPAEPTNAPPASPRSRRPSAEPEPGGPTNAMAIHGRFAYRTGDDGSLAPREGFSLGATFHHRFVRAADLFGVGVEIAFFHDQFSSGDSTNITLEPRRLIHDTFVAMPTFALELEPVRPWIAAGAGMTVAQTTATELQPVARGSVGIDVRIAPLSALVVRADYTAPLGTDTGAFLDVGLGFLYRF